MAKYDFDRVEASGVGGRQNSDAQVVRFFSLANDNGEAIVRFPYTSSNQLDVYSVHSVQIGKSWRNISCLKSDIRGDDDACPFCKAAENPDSLIGKAKLRCYLKIVEYDRDDKGNIVKSYKIWDRPLRFVHDKLVPYFEDYNGNISDIVFKIKRHGAPRDMQTTYDIMPTRSDVYSPAVYVKDPTAFADYDIHQYCVLAKTKQEMSDFLATGTFNTDSSATKETAHVATPVASSAPVSSPSSYHYESDGITEVSVNVPKATTVPAKDIGPKETVNNPELPATNPLPRRYSF